MKYAMLHDVLNFSWRQVAAAFWHRYPNPKSDHVLTVDTFYRELQGDKLVTKRLITKKNSISLPGWGQKICPKFVYIVEESVIDPSNKTITTYTRNVGTSQTFCTCHEKCVYTPSPEDGYEINLQREVYIKSFMSYVGGAIEKIGLRGFKHKAAPNSTKGFNYVLTKMYHPEALVEEPHTLTERLKESKVKVKESTGKQLERIKESKDKVKESTEKQFKRMETFLAEKKAKSKEKLMKSKEKMIAKKEKVQESAQKVADRSKESKDKVKESIKESKEKIKE